MESRFGHDFSDVKVHSDERAARHAKALDAQAFTVDSNIVFDSGRYRPQSPEGRGLLAHELAHVVQQSAAGSANSNRMSRPGDADEAGAHRAVSDIAANRKPQLNAAGAGVHRQAAADAPAPLFPPDVRPQQQSQAEQVLESFLNRMWEAQSKQEQPLRISPGVLEGINIVFPLGAPVRLLEIFDSTRQVMDRLRSRLPATLEPNAVAVLDDVPKHERSLATTSKPKDLEPAGLAGGSVLPEIALTLAGAGVGAGTGAAIGGGLGAGIGALAGAASGLTVALIRRKVQQT